MILKHKYRDSIPLHRHGGIYNNWKLTEGSKENVPCCIQRKRDAAITYEAPEFGSSWIWSLTLFHLTISWALLYSTYKKNNFKESRQGLTSKIIMRKQETCGKFHHNDLSVALELAFLFNKLVCRNSWRTKPKQKAKENSVWRDQIWLPIF